MDPFVPKSTPNKFRNFCITKDEGVVYCGINRNAYDDRAAPGQHGPGQSSSSPSKSSESTSTALVGTSEKKEKAKPLVALYEDLTSDSESESEYMEEVYKAPLPAAAPKEAKVATGCELGEKKSVVEDQGASVFLGETRSNIKETESDAMRKIIMDRESAVTPPRLASLSLEAETPAGLANEASLPSSSAKLEPSADAAKANLQAPVEPPPPPPAPPSPEIVIPNHKKFQYKLWTVEEKEEKEDDGTDNQPGTSKESIKPAMEIGPDESAGNGLQGQSSGAGACLPGPSSGPSSKPSSLKCEKTKAKETVTDLRLSPYISQDEAAVRLSAIGNVEDTQREITAFAAIIFTGDEFRTRFHEERAQLNSRRSLNSGIPDEVRAAPHVPESSSMGRETSVNSNPMGNQDTTVLNRRKCVITHTNANKRNGHDTSDGSRGMGKQ